MSQYSIYFNISMYASSHIATNSFHFQFYIHNASQLTPYHLSSPTSLSLPPLPPPFSSYPFPHHQHSFLTGLQKSFLNVSLVDIFISRYSYFNLHQGPIGTVPFSILYPNACQLTPYCLFSPSFPSLLPIPFSPSSMQFSDGASRVIFETFLG